MADARKLLNKHAGRGAEEDVERLLARTPNPSRYVITKHEQVGSHLVLEVQYSSCPQCSFDSRKVMVFLHTSVGQALYWTTIDPHFVERPPNDHARVSERYQAPGPRARFPADEEGWKDATDYAQRKCTP